MSRWSDDGFLDGLRAQSDPLADETVAELIDDQGVDCANRVFALLRDDSKSLPDDTPAPLRRFLEQTCSLPEGVDCARLERGADAFMERAASGSIILLASSLPQGYASPSLCEILSISNNLATHPYKRLMGVVQLLVNLSMPGAFAPGGAAIANAQKLRLLHAGVRQLVPKHRPDYCERFGAPVNHEDMLATIMAFSYLVVDGFETLGLRFPDADDFYYSWRIFAQMMGIHPDGEPDSASYVPGNLDEAKAFYKSYARRNYTDAKDNPHGPILAAQNLAMMEALIPRGLRLIGFDRAPQVVMTQLLSKQAMERVDLEPANGGLVVEEMIKIGLSFGERIAGRAPHLVEVLARHVFQDMIDRARGAEVTFVIPDSMASIRGAGLV